MKCLVVLFCSALLIGQESPKASIAPTKDAPAVPLEVLTDTRGVDFNPYLKPLLKNVKEKWIELIPSSVAMNKGKVVLEFGILKNGSIVGLRFAKGSGVIAMDRAAYGSISASNPFPALPSEFLGPYLGLRLTFLYNLHQLTVSPKSVILTAGKTQQFMASPVESREIVEWSLKCSDQACGAISECGLYVAPSNVPQTPSIKISAILKARPTDGQRISSEELGEDTATVTIVEPAISVEPTTPP